LVVLEECPNIELLSEKPDYHLALLVALLHMLACGLTKVLDKLDYNLLLLAALLTASLHLLHLLFLHLLYYLHLLVYKLEFREADLHMLFGELIKGLQDLELALVALLRVVIVDLMQGSHKLLHIVVFLGLFCVVNLWVV